MKAAGILTRDIWLNFSELGQHSKEEYPVFHPRDIAKIIKAGLKDGWTPKENGKPHILKLDNSFVEHYGIHK